MCIHFFFFFFNSKTKVDSTANIILINHIKTFILVQVSNK
jgi:hypothetical protein